MKNILCTICMRSGSVGLKNKHLVTLGRKPLMYHTIDFVNSLKLHKHIVVSSDSKKILNYSKRKKIKNLLLRPKYLSSSKASKLKVLQHALFEMEKKFNTTFDYLIDFDATSPIRKKTDFQRAFKIFLRKNADLLITVTPSRKNPYFNMIQISNKKTFLVKNGNFVRRQDTPRIFDMNASFYIFKRKYLLNCKKLISKNTVAYIMPKKSAFDIDDIIDLKINEILLKQ